MLGGVIGLGVQTWGTDVAALKRYWTSADELGFTRVTYGDGLWRFTHDGWSMLGALATVTRRIRLGPAVTYTFDASSHHPSWLAKRAVTIDHLSGGRLDLRLGLGADDPHTAAVWRSHGIAYPPAAERLARLDESVQIVRALWRGTPLEHRGRAHALTGASLEPRPVQRPGPPVWIAAMRPAGLALVARRAEGWEASYVTPEAFEGAWRVLRQRLGEEGRSPAALGRSVELDVALAAGPGDATRMVAEFCAARGIGHDHPLAATVLAGEPEAVAARIAAYAAAGATDLMLGFTDFPSTRMLESFALHVRPRLVALAERPVPG
jgi:alkanesulfonate monooxygenase SsuD/methylene tetrahydromethanopterin reductase-like flavin-dependent oxidoreductase (luciferase family)